MKIKLITFSLECGGAERAITNLANAWVRDGNAIEITCICSSTRPIFFNLSQAIKVLNLGYNLDEGFVRRILSYIRIVGRLRKDITAYSPDLVISFLSWINVLTLLSLAFRKIPVIISERGDPLREPSGTLWRIARLVTYPLARAIVTTSHEALKRLPIFFRHKAIAIYSPITVDAGIVNQFVRRNRIDKIVSVGRLCNEKGYDYLIKAFADFAAKSPNSTLTIYGDGPQRKKLEYIIDRLNLNDKVFLPGYDKNPLLRVAESDIFILSSIQEGMPQALIEAMLLGKPVISTDCPTGPKEVVINEYNGLLVRAGSSLAIEDALMKLVSNDAMRDRLGHNAKDLKALFDPHQIMKQWDFLMAAVLRGDRKFQSMGYVNDRS